MQFREGQFDS
nr:unnamed protein product [Callosobruchus chinensis]